MYMILYAYVKRFVAAAAVADVAVAVGAVDADVADSALGSPAMGAYFDTAAAVVGSLR